jgi:hypothetical protein
MTMRLLNGNRFSFKNNKSTVHADIKDRKIWGLIH